MKFRILKNEPLEFYNEAGDLTGQVIISGSGDLIIRAESGSRDVIIGDNTTTGDVEIGTTAAPVTLKLMGGGTITGNGSNVYIGNATSGEHVVLYNAIYSQSLQVTGSVDVTGSVFADNFIGDGGGVTGVISSSYAETASFAQSGNGIFSGSFSGSFQGNGSGLKSIGGGNATVGNFYYSISNSVDTRPIFEDDNVIFNWDETGNDLEFEMKVAPGGSGDMRSLAYIIGGSTQNTYITTTSTPYDVYAAGVASGERLEVFITAENDVTYPAYHVTVYNTGESFENIVWIRRIVKD